MKLVMILQLFLSCLFSFDYIYIAFAFFLLSNTLSVQQILKLLNWFKNTFQLNSSEHQIDIKLTLLNTKVALYFLNFPGALAMLVTASHYLHWIFSPTSCTKYHNNNYTVSVVKFRYINYKTPTLNSTSYFEK